MSASLDPLAGPQERTAENNKSLRRWHRNSEGIWDSFVRYLVQINEDNLHDEFRPGGSKRRLAAQIFKVIICVPSVLSPWPSSHGVLFAAVSSCKSVDVSQTAKTTFPFCPENSAFGYLILRNLHSRSEGFEFLWSSFQWKKTTLTANYRGHSQLLTFSISRLNPGYGIHSIIVEILIATTICFYGYVIRLYFDILIHK